MPTAKKKPVSKKADPLVGLTKRVKALEQLAQVFKGKIDALERSPTSEIQRDIAELEERGFH